jgi:hypothetical protein
VFHHAFVIYRKIGGNAGIAQIERNKARLFPFNVKDNFIRQTNTSMSGTLNTWNKRIPASASNQELSQVIIGQKAVIEGLLISLLSRGPAF